MADAVAKHGVGMEEDLSELISAEDVKEICVKSYLEKCTPNQAAVIIRLYWDRIYD